MNYKFKQIILNKQEGFLRDRCCVQQCAFETLIPNFRRQLQETSKRKSLGFGQEELIWVRFRT